MKLTGKKGKADKLFSEYIRREGICEWCGKHGENAYLQCAHIFSRRYNVTRYSPLNAVCLCAGCHRKAHDRPVDFTEFVKEYLGSEVYDELRRLAKTSVKKIDLDEIISDLKQKLESK